MSFLSQITLSIHNLKYKNTLKKTYVYIYVMLNWPQETGAGSFPIYLRLNSVESKKEKDGEIKTNKNNNA